MKSVTTPNWSSRIFLPTSIAIFLSARNIFLSTPLGNTLLLIALHLSTNKTLFRCVVVTDLYVGLISQPVSAFLLINYNIFKTNLIASVKSVRQRIFLSYSLESVILVLTSAAVSVDRLLALFLRLRFGTFGRHLRSYSLFLFKRYFVKCPWLILDQISLKKSNKNCHIKKQRFSLGDLG